MVFIRLEQFLLEFLDIIASNRGGKGIIEKGLEYWRRRIVLAIYVVFVTAGLVACIPSVWVAIDSGKIWIAVVNVASYTACLYFLFSKQCSFKVRAYALLLIIYGIALTLLLNVNPIYALMWLFCFSVVASVLFGFSAACWALLLNSFTLVVVGILINLGRVSWDPISVDETLGWFILSINFLLLNSVIAIAIATLVERLKQTIEKEQKATRLLTREHERISQEVKQRKEAQGKQKLLQEKLQQDMKMKTIGLMAGGVAHDLNNILSGIVSYPELLLRQLPAESELHEPMTIIRDSGKRAADVVDNLLTIARDAPTAMEVTNVKNLVEDFIHTPECQKIQHDHSNVELVLEMDPDLANMYCSPLHIKKCLLNLILNGYEAIDDGGKVIVSCRNQNVSGLPAQELQISEGEYVVLGVTDTGSGISSEDIDHIFEPFYTRKKMGKSGSGLGLAVVWNSVQQHRGGIQVESDRSGTTFRLYFPSTKETVSMAKPEESDILELYGNNEKILVVDDELLQRDVAVNLLRLIQYDAVAVSSGEEAIEYLREHSVDLVVLDMIMEPGINGRQTYEKIIAENPGQKAIVVSGFSINDEVVKVQELGASIFVKKPYSLVQLGKAIKETLGLL